MSQRSEKRSNKAKSIIAQPLFRSRQERAKKGKGSYRRDKQASRSNHPEAFLFLAA
ncbi:MAG: ribosome alternative rescue factor ArfA [Gammaproteobacteria bacterium]|nr:ribosome alternative rescue factor ArfA [Gammaproteobacteria bacterium]HKM26003.1 alternative ribosome rescue factor ArfA [Thiopseudomonas sp.]